MVEGARAKNGLASELKAAITKTGTSAKVRIAPLEKMSPIVSPPCRVAPKPDRSHPLPLFSQWNSYLINKIAHRVGRIHIHEELANKIRFIWLHDPENRFMYR